MFVVNSRLGLSSVAYVRSIRFVFHGHRLSFSLSYGYILPSSLTRVLPRTLGFSPRLPVSVYGTGAFRLSRSFSRQLGSLEFDSALASSIYHCSALACGFACIPAYLLRRALPSARSSYLLCHSIDFIDFTAVLDSLPVFHRLRSLPRLRSRLTLSRRSLLRNP